MSLVTFQIISGMEQGRILQLPTPVTIGREEENSLRLNDDRISRFHAKVQEDSGRVVLTDLDSTNGTRVNGLPVQMRVLQLGDHVMLGRSVLVFGSPEEVAERLRLKPETGHGLDAPTRRGGPEDEQSAPSRFSDEFEFFPHGPPELPLNLRPVQAAQLSDLLAYVHSQVGSVIENSSENAEGGESWIHIPAHSWQRILALQMTLASYLLELSEPNTQ